MVVQSSRKLALCVSTWSSESTLYMWNYTKQYLLRKQHSPAGAGLHPGDSLYIVHVHSPKQGGGSKRGAWQIGGALMHNMQDALDRYPHTIVELTGSNVTAATLDWAEGEGIDILVMGFRDAKVKAAMTKVIPGEWGLGSVSGRTLQHTRVPLLVVRPDAALKLNKLRTQQPSVAAGSVDQAAAAAVAAEDSLTTKSVPTLTRTLSPGRLPKFAPAESRKVGIAFEQDTAGANMLRWAAAHLLQTSDQVYIVQITSGPALAPAPSLGTMLASVSALAADTTSGTSGGQAEPTIASELDTFNVVLNKQLQGDPRDAIINFVREEGLDLLLVGRSLGGRFKKAFTPGGTVSQHVVSHASCPVLVLPAKAAQGDSSPQYPLSPRDARTSIDQQPSVLRRGSGGIMSAPTSPTAVTAPGGSQGSDADMQQMRRQLSERNGEVQQLRQEVFALKEQLRQLQPNTQSIAAGAQVAIL